MPLKLTNQRSPSNSSLEALENKLLNINSSGVQDSTNLKAKVQNQSEYMRIFEDLLGHALKQQAFSLKHIDSEIIPQKDIIMRSNTKSFRELC